MRFLRLILVVSVAAAFQSAAAQAQPQPENSNATAREMSLAKSVHLFPNPAIEYVDVKLDQFPAQNAKLTVHNIIGNELQVETEILDEHLIRVKVKDLVAGYYLLAVKDEESNFRGTYKFLKR